MTATDRIIAVLRDHGAPHGEELAEAILKAVTSGPDALYDPQLHREMRDGTRCPRCGDKAALGQWGVCQPCAVQEGWESAT